MAHGAWAKWWAVTAPCRELFDLGGGQDDDAAHRLDLDASGQLHEAQQLLEDRLCLVKGVTLLFGQLLQGLARDERRRLAWRSVGARLAWGSICSRWAVETGTAPFSIRASASAWSAGRTIDSKPGLGARQLDHLVGRVAIVAGWGDRRLGAILIGLG